MKDIDISKFSAAKIELYRVSSLPKMPKVVSHDSREME